MIGLAQQTQRPFLGEIITSSRSGFTLIEMSVVMVIMGLVIMTVFPALTSARQANQQALTQSNLRSLITATAAFVQANGCLPCPAAPGGTGTNFGKVNTPNNIACGQCPAIDSAPQGIPPFVSLGVPASTARDGWGHWITMRVDPALTNPLPVSVPPTAPCTLTDVGNGICTSAQIGFSIKGLCKAGTSSSIIKITTTGNGATQNAAVLFVSHGSSGYGSYVATPSKSGFLLPFASNYAACTGSRGYAQCNSAERNSTQFYDAPTIISDMDAYDDVLAYANRNTLVSMLGNGACNSNWTSP